MDKLVGKLVAELDRLKLREQTLVIFFGDNGTATARADRATIGGRRLAGAKGSMLEGGGRVPLIASWPGVTPAGKVSEDLVDASDFLPTFAELAGAELPPRPSSMAAALPPACAVKKASRAPGSSINSQRCGMFGKPVGS